MSTEPAEAIAVPTDDGELGTLRWRGTPGSPVVFALPGEFDNAWAWSSVARHLDGRVALVALDLRGRGSSSDAPGPFGVQRHVADLVHVIRRFNAAPAVLVGQSLGAVVALCAADRHPEFVDGVVLVEGGPPLARRAGDTPEDAVERVVAPYVELVERTWPDRVSYLAAWSEIPPLRDHLTPEIERYLLSDLVETDDGFRSRTRLDAVRRDLLDLFTDVEIRTLLDRRATPTTIVRAARGRDGASAPDHADPTMHRYHWHDWRTVTGCNSFSILASDDGAKAVADAILDEVDAVRRRS